MPCVTIPGNLNVPWVQIVKLDPNDKTNVNYDEDIMNGIIYEAACPVDLVVTDPDNLVISKDINQIPGAMYIDKEYDEYGNSSPCNMIWIPDRKLGNYSIQVIPWSTANDSDTFTLTASPSEDKWGYTPIVLAQNVSVSDIPAEPYTFEVKQRTATNISYTGDVSGYNLDTINLTAVLSTENGSLLSGKTINFVIGNQSVSAVTNSNGVATTSITLNQTPSEFYYVEYGFDGDKDYLPFYDYQPFVIPPMADAGGPYTGTEGSPITLNGSGTRDPESRTISYEWDLDNDGVYDDATGVTPAYTWNDDYSDSIGLRVTDDSGAISTATATVTINNIPPTVEAGADINNAIAGTAINFNGSLTDPGTLDTHTIEWNFGDGSPTVKGTLTPTHTYTSSGNYTVILTITDDDGGIGTDTLAINVMPATTTYTFTSGGGTNKWCSAGHIHLIDWNNGHPSSPSDFANSYGYTAGGVTAYSAVSSSDSSSWRSNISHDLGCCAFDRNCEIFKFKINESPSSITNIQIKWIGHGTTGETIYYTTEKLWKASNNTWNTLNNKMNIRNDTIWTNNISSSCANYIDSTRNLSILVAAQRSGLPNNCGIWTNYIEVTITH
jgi:PKD repeat protein